MAAGIDEAEGIAAKNHRLMVVGTKQKIHSAQRPVQIHPLVFQRFSISFTGSGMDGHDHQMGLQARAETIHILLDQGQQTLEGHAAPEIFRKPVLYVRIGVSKHQDPDPLALNQFPARKIGFSIVRPEGISGQKRNALRIQLLCDAVVHRMPRLDIMVSDSNGIVAQICGHAREDMRRQGIHVIEIIGSVVPLKDIASIQEDYMLPARCGPNAVYGPFDGVQRFFDPLPHIGRIEEGAVQVVGGQDFERIGSVPRAAAGREKQSEQDKNRNRTDLHHH